MRLYFGSSLGYGHGGDRRRLSYRRGGFSYYWRGLGYCGGSFSCGRGSNVGKRLLGHGRGSRAAAASPTASTPGGCGGSWGLSYYGLGIGHRRRGGYRGFDGGSWGSSGRSSGLFGGLLVSGQHSLLVQDFINEVLLAQALKIANLKLLSNFFEVGQQPVL